VKIGGVTTVVPYNPVDLNFNVESDDSITLVLGEWIREQLQDVASKVPACSASKFRRSNVVTLTSCGMQGYADGIGQNENLVLRLRAFPEPVVVQAAAAVSTNLVAQQWLGAITVVGGLQTLVALLWLTWGSQSTSMGSAGTGAPIPPAIRIPPPKLLNGGGNGNPTSPQVDTPNANCPQPNTIVSFMSPPGNISDEGLSHWESHWCQCNDRYCS
jgi:hypothetical protein